MPLIFAFTTYSKRSYSDWVFWNLECPFAYISETFRRVYMLSLNLSRSSNRLIKQSLWRTYIKPETDGCNSPWQFTDVIRASEPSFIGSSVHPPTSPPSENIRLIRPHSGNCRYGVNRELHVTVYCTVKRVGRRMKLYNVDCLYFFCQINYKIFSYCAQIRCHLQFQLWWKIVQ